MEAVIHSLETLISNARKSLGRPYSQETISTKLQEIETLEKELAKLLYSENIEVDIRQKSLDRFEKLKTESLEVLKVHTKGKPTVTKKEDFKIINMDANELSAVIKLIPIFSGKREELHNFTTNLEILEQTIAQEKKSFFFSFVFKSRLDLRVQNRIKQYTVPTTIAELISVLKKVYKPLKSSNTVLNELTGLVQKNNNLSGFVTKIDNLVSELNEMQIAEEGEENRISITSTNNKIAFNTFVNGLQDQQLVSTIDASQVTKFSDAVQIAEKFASRIKQKSILYHNSQPNRYNGNKRQFRSNSNNNPNRSYNNSRTNTNNNNNRYNENRYTNNNRYNNFNNNNRNNHNNNIRSNNYRNRASGRNNGYNNRNQFINQVHNQGNSQIPEIIRPASSEITQ